MKPNYHSSFYSHIKNAAISCTYTFVFQIPFAKGIYKSPLQGIPYGLKDLFAVKGTRTTYGTPPYKDQVLNEDAFVYQQLEKAGAVLIAKVSMGELAMDDIWFGGQTKKSRSKRSDLILICAGKLHLMNQLRYSYK